MRKRPNRPINRALFGDGVVEKLSPVALDSPERILAYCKDAGFIDGSSTNIEALIGDTENLNLKYDDLGENDAYIKKVGADSYDIVINERHPPVRQKFSMAHEYIHFQFHREEIENMPEGEKILHRSEERNRIEYQANQLAADILMPEDVFVSVARRFGGDISRIAEEFKVSTLAVRYRAKRLGINGHGY